MQRISFAVLCVSTVLALGACDKSNEDSETTGSDQVDDGGADSDGHNDDGNTDSNKTDDGGRDSGDGDGDGGDGDGDPGDGDGDPGDGDGDPGDGDGDPGDGDGDGEGDGDGDVDGEMCGAECSLFDDLCPEGERCAAWVCDPESRAWDKDICALDGPQGKGEECKPPWVATPEETCGKNLMCWGGRCQSTCNGSKQNPNCDDPAELCLIGNDGVLAVCMTKCDPFAVDCPGTMDVCLPGGENPQGFVCVGRGCDDCENTGNRGDTCMYLNECKPGNYCVDRGLVDAPGCDADYCCTIFCSIDENACPGAAEECVPVLEEKLPGYEDVGVCVIPI